MKNGFSALHPATSFLFFATVLLVTMLFLHPVILTLSFLAAITFSLRLDAKKAAKLIFGMCLPISLIWTAVNPLINHEGLTPLLYINGMAYTQEALIYGAVTGIMFSAVLMWFSCFNHVMTTDKLLFLFSRFFPAVSLMLSMILRFIPRYTVQAEHITDARKGIGRSADEGNVIRRAKNGSGLMLILTQWSMENAIDTADSMNARGYGAARRTRFQSYRFTHHDCRSIILPAVLLIATVIGLAAGYGGMVYFPLFKFDFSPFSPFSLCFFAAYAVFMFFPVLHDALEALKWQYYLSKI